MKRSKDRSLFKIALFVCAVLYFKSLILFLLLFLLLFLEDNRKAILFVILSILLVLINRYRMDVMPLGMVEEKREKYVIADKIFYKTKVFCEDDLKPGDVLYFKSAFKKNSISSQINKNILFEGEDCQKLFCFYPRTFIYETIHSQEALTKEMMEKLLYNIDPVQGLDFDLGYGLASYYFFRFLNKKSKRISLILFFIYSLFFVFPIKHYLILIDMILDHFSLNKEKKASIKILILCCINFSLFQNYSFLLPLLFEMYSLFSLDLDFKTYMAFLTIFFFGQCDPIKTFTFSFLIRIRIFLFLFSFLVLLCPFLEGVYLFLIRIFSRLLSFDLSIRGTVSIFGTVLLISIFRHFHIQKGAGQYVILLLVTLLPIHDPFFHVSFIDVGQGDSIMIKKPFRHSCTLIDTGSPFNYYKLKTFLFRQGIYQIDHLIITHNDSDHNGNVEALKEDFKVKDIVTQGRDIEYNGLFLDHLDLLEFDNDNDNSLVYLMKVKSLSFLFTGDISKKAERDLILRHGPLDVDILKVSHHGSKTGSSDLFISQILPAVSVISTSGLYGHPNKEVLDVLNSYKSRFFLTSESGTVSVYITRFLSFIKTAKYEFVIIRE